MADTTVTVTEDVTNVTIEADTAITITEDVTEVDITATTPVSITSAGGISFNAYGGISSCTSSISIQFERFQRDYYYCDEKRISQAPRQS